MRTQAVIILATLSAVLVPGVAHAAPGDCQILAGQPVCEPYPPNPDNPFPLGSVCTPLAPAGELPRKSCQSFLTETGELVGEPQTFIYPPENDLEAPPVPAPVAPRAPYVAPAGNDEANDSAPLNPRPTPVVPAPSAPATVEAAEPTAAPTTSPARIDAAPISPSPGRPAAHRSWVDAVDGAVPWAAGIAALVLVLALVWRPRTR